MASSTGHALRTGGTSAKGPPQGEQAPRHPAELSAGPRSWDPPGSQRDVCGQHSSGGPQSRCRGPGDARSKPRDVPGPSFVCVYVLAGIVCALAFSMDLNTCLCSPRAESALPTLGSILPLADPRCVERGSHDFVNQKKSFCRRASVSLGCSANRRGWFPQILFKLLRCVLKVCRVFVSVAVLPRTRAFLVLSPSPVGTPCHS